MGSMSSSKKIFENVPMNGFEVFNVADPAEDDIRAVGEGGLDDCFLVKAGYALLKEAIGFGPRTRLDLRLR